MVILDISIVNVALPTIHASLGFSDTGLQWVVNAYTLTFAGFLMLAGRATDLLGRRQVFLVGVGLFAVASLGCALADGQAVLIGARAIQGFGAAVISAASLAIVTASFDEGAERNRALGLWARDGRRRRLGRACCSAAPSPQALQLARGLHHQRPGRHRGRPRRPPVSSRGARGRRASASFDVPGAVLISGGLTAIVYGIVRTDSLGWGSPGVLVRWRSALALLGLFALVEGKLSRATR